jgi:hypothetical protein
MWRRMQFSVRELFSCKAATGPGRHQACAEVRDIAARHLLDVRAKIVDLKAMQ